MPLKKSVGNMYAWATHTHSHLGGACYHGCKYCYVQKNRFGVPERYKGDSKLIEKEFDIKYDEKTLKRDSGVYPGTIFIEHMNDLFSRAINIQWIERIINHCLKYPENKYIVQTKNIEMALNYFMSRAMSETINNFIIGTTVETDIELMLANAPERKKRLDGINMFNRLGYKTFITIEPIMKFTPEFGKLLVEARPDFINIGADSKRCGLPEPSKQEVLTLIYNLKNNGIEVKQKSNLGRLII
jgi:DNA repair photolyase